MFTGKATTSLGLPIFEPDDHPDFLTDFNEAFRRIDASHIEVREKLESLEQRIRVLEEKVARLESLERLESEE